MEYQINIQDLDVVVYQKIVQRKVPGMLRMTVDHNGGITYEKTGMIPLEIYLQKNSDDKTKLELMQQISFLLMCMDSFYMKAENVDLDENAVWIEEKTGNVYLTYYPSLTPRIKNPLMMRLKVLFDSIFAGREGCCTYSADSQKNLFKETNVYQETTLFEQGRVQNQDGKTMLFEVLQESAEKSKARIARRKQGIFSDVIRDPRLIRNSTGEEVKVHGNIFKIGKDKDYVDYCIADNPAISKSHADISRRDGVFYIVDNHSLNGTKVNGELIIPGKMVQLVNGSTISMANEQFSFLTEEDE